MFRIKTRHLLVLLGLIAPVYSYGANYCIASGGGFGSGGASFIGPGFALPLAGKCKPWSGFTKAASTVVLTSTGTGCLSSDGKVLTFSIYSSDPAYLSSSTIGEDYIQFCPPGTKSCPVGAGSDQGTFAGTAAPQTCTTALLKLPSTHN
jgi:hypothetical protein